VYDVCFSGVSLAYATRKILKFVVSEEGQAEILKWCDAMHKELLGTYLKIEVGVRYKEGSVCKFKTHYKFLDSNSWKLINDKTLLDSDIPNPYIMKWLESSSS
jgi:hypothetical protein